MENPLVSFCLFTYNQEKFVLDALRGAVSQDYENMEIIVSDDCSTDNTFTIIENFFENYKGDKKIILNRNTENIGIREHCNKVLIELSHGDIIVLAAGDDVSLPERCSESVRVMTKHPEVSSLSFSSLQVDMNLNSLNRYIGGTPLISNNYSLFSLDDYINFGEWLIFSGDSRVIRRSVIDAFPPLKYSNAEDIFLFIRSMYIGSIAFVRKPLSLYRQHGASVMGQHRRKSEEHIYATEDELENFKNTTEKQIWSDFEYAISHGYIKEECREMVSMKLEWVISSLRPQLPPPPPKHSKKYYKLKHFVGRVVNLFVK